MPQPPRQPFVVILTGGIASGKTAVSDRFARLGVPVIDTDLIAREVVAPGQPALAEIREAFGPEFLAADGQLDRRRMRETIFRDPVQKARLEAILHPRISAVARQRVAQAQGPYVLLVVPLLAEARRQTGSAYAWGDRVLLVDVEPAVQVERLVRRDSITREQAEETLRAQSSRPERLAFADDIIRNDGELGDLDSAVARLHARYLELAVRSR